MYGTAYSESDPKPGARNRDARTVSVDCSALCVVESFERIYTGVYCRLTEPRDASETRVLYPVSVYVHTLVTAVC